MSSGIDIMFQDHRLGSALVVILLISLADWRQSAEVWIRNLDFSSSQNEKTKRRFQQDNRYPP